MDGIKLKQWSVFCLQEKRQINPIACKKNTVGTNNKTKESLVAYPGFFHMGYLWYVRSCVHKRSQEAGAAQGEPFFRGDEQMRRTSEGSNRRH